MENKITAKEFRNILLFLVPILIFTLVYNWIIKQRLASCNRVNIGILTHYQVSFEGNKLPVISHKLNGQIYSGIASIKHNKIGARYFLRYHCNNPSTFRIIENISVPDTLKYIPTNGWKKVPYELERYKKVIP